MFCSLSSLSAQNSHRCMYQKGQQEHCMVCSLLFLSLVSSKIGHGPHMSEILRDQRIVCALSLLPLSFFIRVVDIQIKNGHRYAGWTVFSLCQKEFWILVSKSTLRRCHGSPSLFSVPRPKTTLKTQIESTLNSSHGLLSLLLSSKESPKPISKRLRKWLHGLLCSLSSPQNSCTSNPCLSLFLPGRVSNTRYQNALWTRLMACSTLSISKTHISAYINLSIFSQHLGPKITLQATYARYSRLEISNSLAFLFGQNISIRI